MNLFGGFAPTPPPRPLGSRHDSFTEAPAGVRPIPSLEGCRKAAGWVSPAPGRSLSRHLGARPSWPLAGWKPALLKGERDALHSIVICSNLLRPGAGQALRLRPSPPFVLSVAPEGRSRRRRRTGPPPRGEGMELVGATLVVARPSSSASPAPSGDDFLLPSLEGCRVAPVLSLSKRRGGFPCPTVEKLDFYKWEGH